MAILSYESIFISDIHLGLRAARTEYPLAFLKHVECKNLFLVGDIFDICKMRTGWHWPAINNEIIRLVIEMARQGTRVVYIPGNHDELFREYQEFHFSGIDVRREVIHKTRDGRNYIVLHGDEFDCVVMSDKWLAHLGSGAYYLLLWLNRWFNFARRKLGFGYWSLSAYLKNQVKGAVKYIGNFEQAVIHEARGASWTASSAAISIMR